MCKNSGSSPSAPDPNLVAQAQSRANNQAASYNAALNRTSSVGPYGSSTWGVTGIDPTTGAPIYGNNTTLNPNAQGALNNQQANQNAQTGLAGNILNNSASMLANPLDPSGINQNAAKAAYNSSMDLIQPQQDQAQEALKSQLAAQGITDPNSQAYQQATGNLNRQQQWQNNNLANQSTLTGIQAGNTAFNQNALAQNQAMSLYNGLNNPNIGMPTTLGSNYSTSTNPTDMASLYNNVYQGQIGNYNTQVGQQNALLGGLSQLGSAYLMAG